MADLVTWIVDDVKWDRGSPSVWDRQCTTTTTTGGGDVEKGEVAETTTLNCAASPTATASAGPIDMCDVIKEKSRIIRNISST